MKRTLLLILLIAGPSVYSAFGQTNERLRLIETIEEECEILFINNQDLCPLGEEVLVRKFEHAEDYLIDEMKSWKLTSKSNFYESKKDELERLNSQSFSTKTLDTIDKRLDLMLVVSALKPLEADSVFLDILYQLAGAPFMYKNYSHVNFSRSFIAYQIWLFTLKDQRFSAETDRYSYYLNQALYWFDNIDSKNSSELLNQYDEVPFVDFDKEEALMIELDSLARMSFDTSRTDLYKKAMTENLEARAISLSRLYESQPSTGLDSAIVCHYLLALTFNPDSYRLYHNLATHYMNAAIQIQNSIISDIDSSENLNIEEMESKVAKGEQYVKIAAYYNSIAENLKN